MTPRQRRAWQALGLGPVWQEKPSMVAPEGAAPGVEHPVIFGSVTHPSEPRPGATMAEQPAETVASAAGSLDWDGLRDAVRGCTRCGLCRTRRQTVFGVGPTEARWLIVGEAPGAEEDARGEPFVGQAGRLLDAMLAALGMSRNRDVFITNVLKCRPPGNRNPEPDEVEHCAPYLRRQVELLAPDGMLVMGRFAAQALLGTDASIASLRGRVHECRLGERGVPAVVTYHPAYLLRNLPDKAKAWADLCLARDRLGFGKTGPR
jgi:uracil-DNA glycosylase family 4